MKKRIFLITTVCLFGILSITSADDSTVTGDADLSINTMGIILNASAFSDTEANIGSVVVSNESDFTGNAASESYASAIIMNAALGLTSEANLSSVKIENNSSMTGNVSTKTSGAAILNISGGVNSRASMSSVVLE